MKRLAMTISTLAILVACPTAEARFQYTESMAWDYADLTMSRKYGDAWEAYLDYYGGGITCYRHPRKHVRRCHANWSPGGDVGYLTRLRVIYRGGWVHHRVRVVGRTKVTDYYCLNVTHPGDYGACVDVHRVGPVRYRN